MPMTGIAFKAMRRKVGFTQKQMAEALGLHWNSVARMERGEIGISEPVVKLVRVIVAREKGKRL